MTAPTSDHVVGIDGIAVVVNKKNPVVKLSTRQLAAIFAGEAGDWSAVGGGSGPIHLYTRDAKSGTFDAFTAMAMGGRAIKADAKAFDDSEALSAAVAADPGGVGYVGLPYVRDAHAVAVQDGDAMPLYPTAFTVSTEDYALSRRLHFYTPEAPKSPLTRPFVEYALSDAGQRIVEQSGFVSLVLRTDSPPALPGAPPGYEADVRGALRLSVDFRFRTGSSELDTRARSDVDRVLRFLSAPENRGKHVILHGFADRQGNEKANVELSKTRAEAVAMALKQRGVTPGKTSGWGSDLPIAPNDTPEGRERNRRVEIWVR
jgi:phosphate transport system substrate-binding protein